ncbi:MAG: hypothetical protein REI78_14590 [Pedobacter sp.]|nr:hypothetical protein [Pedobacter sp.]
MTQENPFSRLVPDWGNTFVSEDSAKRIYEIRLKNPEKLISIRSMPSPDQIEQQQKSHEIKLLVFEDKKSGKILYGAYMSLESRENIINCRFHYRQLSGFNGSVIYYHFDGRLSNGWTFENGSVKKSIHSISKVAYDGLRSATTGKIMQVTCITGPVAIYNWGCVGAEFHEVCGYHFNRYDYVTECFGDEGLEGELDHPSEPGGGGEYFPPVYNDFPPSEEEILDSIENKPFALFKDVDCNTLRNWLATAKFAADNTSINKLNSLSQNALHGDMSNRVAAIQKIDDAYSTTVNMDYFSVTVSQLPEVNGQRLGPGQFLNYIRTNINSFTNGKAIFDPYSDYGIDDNALWNSTSPKGAILKIDLFGPNDGSVITSYSSTDRWTFTTIYEPIYGEHPVSGNRNFGYTANTDGSYTFYTRGVDRLTSWSGEMFQNSTSIPFNRSDALWTAFQNQIRDFVTQHDGTALINAPEILRPDWDVVKRVIDGKLPLSRLSKNCPD